MLKMHGHDRTPLRLGYSRDLLSLWAIARAAAGKVTGRSGAWLAASPGAV
jgi:hypothetical protein